MTKTIPAIKYKHPIATKSVLVSVIFPDARNINREKMPNIKDTNKEFRAFCSASVTVGRCIVNTPLTRVATT